MKAFSLPIKCEQSTQESGGLDIWLGRFAMVGFASAITIEIVTGKGLLEVSFPLSFFFCLQRRWFLISFLLYQCKLYFSFLFFILDNLKILFFMFVIIKTLNG